MRRKVLDRLSGNIGIHNKIILLAGTGNTECENLIMRHSKLSLQQTV